MPDEAGLEEVRRVLPGVASLLEPLDVGQEPVDHVGPDEGVRNRDLQPHPIADLQAAVRSLHGLYDLRHGGVYGERFF